MLFKKRSLIYFIHIFKTAGTTVSDILFRNYSCEEIESLYYMPWGSTGQDREIWKVYDSLHVKKKTKIVYGHFAYGIHEQNPDIQYKYMSFIRNPVNREISNYYSLLRVDKEWQFNTLSKLDDSIKTMDDLDANFPSFEKFLSFSEIRNQQCMFLTGYEPNVISQDPKYYAEMAIDNINKNFSFIGITECFNESLKLLNQNLKLKTLEYDYKNKGVNKPQNIIINEDVKKTLYEVSEADMIIYEYVKRNMYNLP